VAGKRTAMGGFQSKLQQFKAPQLGAFAIQGALNSINMDAKLVDEVIMGTVCQANQGQNPARQAALLGGVPIDKPCTTINKVCSSGLKSIVFGSQSIELG
jgi:acetyl-CoA C-acetyltransferase